MQNAPREPDGAKPGPVALQNSLTVLAILLVVTGLVTALFLVVPAAAERELDAGRIFGAVWIVLFGGFGACLCWVATWLIATYYELLFVVGDRKSTRLNSSHCSRSRMPSSA